VRSVPGAGFVPENARKDAYQVKKKNTMLLMPLFVLIAVSVPATVLSVASVTSLENLSPTLNQKKDLWLPSMRPIVPAVNFA
jgi:hypothetical protein